MAESTTVRNLDPGPTGDYGLGEWLKSHNPFGSKPPAGPSEPTLVGDEKGQPVQATQGGVVYQLYSDGNWRPLPGVPAPQQKAASPPGSRYLPDGTYQEWDGSKWVTDPLGFDPTQAAGYQAPRQYAPVVPRFGFQQIGGRVYRTNDLSGALEDTGVSAPGFSNVEVDRSGNLVGIDQNGQYGVIKEGFGFPSIDPERGQAVTEAGVTGFFGGRPTYAREQADRKFGFETAGAAETAGFNRATLAEDARQANLRSATDAFGDVTRVAPEFGKLALANAGFIRDTLKTPPDYLSRAWFQQGKTSPLPQVSTADIINSLRSNIEGFNTTLQGFNPQVGAYTPPPVYQPYVPPVVSAAAPPPTTGPALLQSNLAPDARRVAEEAFRPGGAFGFTSADAPRLAGGGFTREPMFVVGDSRSGEPTGHEEMVTNPTRAPVAVRPMNRYAEGTGATHRMPDGSTMAGAQHPSGNMPKDPEMMADEAKVKAMSKLMGFVENPSTLHALVDEVSEVRGKKKRIPSYANGTGLFGFDLPQLPGVQGPSSQQEIQALERSVRPPAIDTLFGGGVASSPRFGFDLFTPQQYGSLTPDDRSALGTTLATQYNETPENVEYAMQRRFGGSRAAGRATQLAGFAR